jgi:hypothetical protein
MRGSIVVGLALLATAANAAPRSDVEEDRVKDPLVSEVHEIVDNILLPRIQAPAPVTTDGRSVEQNECQVVRVRGKGPDGKTAITRLDWCD